MTGADRAGPCPGQRVEWPDRKRFAFSVFDDTDGDAIWNTQPVYRLLTELGLRTTKSCWVRQPAPGEAALCPGHTTEDPEYRDYLLGLQGLGFEIGLHNVSSASSTREQVRRGLEDFVRQFGHPPAVFANHTGTRDSLYWGGERLTGLRRVLYKALTLFRNRGHFVGHVEGSEHFWGDLCRNQVRYVRNFTFRELDTLAVCPWMPYHDPSRPYVPAWFASCDGHDVERFVAALSESNQDALEAGGGCCIMYTHFASGFFADGRLHAEFERLMRRLSRKSGWFVPVGRLLDHLAIRRGVAEIPSTERARLEWKWLGQKLLMGGTT